MKYEQILNKMWDFFQDTERRFIQTSHNIPLDNHSKTYSIELYNILQTTCGQVENMSRILCDRLGLVYPNKNFFEYFSKLNSNGMLIYQNVYIVPLNDSIKPFITYCNPLPDWWHNYNKTKHNLPEGMKEGNLGNTIRALAGLFNLHHIAYYARFQGNLSKILNQTEWIQRGDDLEDEQIRRSFWAYGFPKSEVFVCTTSLGPPF